MEYILTRNTASLFDSIRREDENGNEYWSARELAPLLGYSQWRRFDEAINRAKESCKSASGDVLANFAGAGKIVKTGVSEKTVPDYHLSRYACYLIAQNGDPRKREIAEAQTYFAIQTRYAEIRQMEEYQSLTTEEEMRLFLRRQMKEHNSQLAEAAKNAGVKERWEYARFQNAGYRGLYGGLDEDAIHSRKGLGEKEKILDHMGSTELAANLFRATQTKDKLEKEHIKGREEASKAHYEVGAIVRRTIETIGGTMPENLPTAESINLVERKRKQIERKNAKAISNKKDK